MTRVRARGEDIRRYILDHVTRHPADVAKVAARHFKVTRQAINKHLQRLVAEMALAESGNTRARTYKLASLFEWQHAYPTRPGLAEDVVWRDDIQPVLGQLPDNVRNIWQHGFTEMLNNAMDHSGGGTILVRIVRTGISTEMAIVDDGVGIFRKIQKAMNLLDERHAVLEVAKGKLTTDPSNHSGEGIFFTSRMFDEYEILSGGVCFSHEYGKDEDWILERPKNIDGTGVFMKLHNHASRTTKQVFDKFSSHDGDYRFIKTVVPVKLAQYGDDQLISRSQAKRLLARVELFKIVLFDFAEVKTAGQAFADEIFRVFANRHPEIDFQIVNANSEVKRMIERARTGTIVGEPASSPGAKGA